MGDSISCSPGVGGVEWAELLAGISCRLWFYSSCLAGIWALGAHVQVQKQMGNVSVPVEVLQHLGMSMAALERPVTPLAAPALLLECLHGFTGVFPQSHRLFGILSFPRAAVGSACVGAQP